jgi:hypothetical protein
MYYMYINKNFLHQVGNNQGYTTMHGQPIIEIGTGLSKLWLLRGWLLHNHITLLISLIIKLGKKNKNCNVIQEHN